MKLRFAVLVLGLVISTVLGCSKDGTSEETAAHRRYRALAEQGDADAQYRLGLIYATEKDEPLNAATWYRLAAEQGQTDAQHCLGLMYAFHDALPRDWVQAYLWLELASRDPKNNVMTQQTYVMKHLTPLQFAKVERLAREWKPKEQKPE